MKRSLPWLGVLGLLLACTFTANILPPKPTEITPSATLPFPSPSVTPAPPPTLIPLPYLSPAVVCTPPACRSDETYFCPGRCPGGCGTGCATVTPDIALRPEHPIETNTRWLMQDDQGNLLAFDPSGRASGFAFQRLGLLNDAVILPRGEVIYALLPGEGTAVLSEIFPENRSRAFLEYPDPPPLFAILTADRQGIVWSRLAAEGKEAEVWLTALTPPWESTWLLTVPIPQQAVGHRLIPFFYDAQRGLLIYALHEFYSGMSQRQVASLYLRSLRTGQETPLVPLRELIYAGTSLAVSADGKILAYLTAGEPQSQHEFKMPWTLHLRSLVNSEARAINLPTLADDAEVHLFSPDGRYLLLTVFRRLNEAQNSEDTLLLYDLSSERFLTLLSWQDGQGLLEPRAWSQDGWLVLSSADDHSTWAMLLSGGQPVRVTPLFFLRLWE